MSRTVRLDSVSKSYDGEQYAVREVSLRIERGELVCLLGTSGCGKTTTLKMINRLIEPTSGHIYLDDQDVTEADPVELRRGIGYVFQGIGLFPHMTVGENVAIVPQLLGWSDTEIRQRVRELLDLVHLAPDQYADRVPSELSGGQRQRVGVARSLAARPGVMLMDEPFGALDPVTRDELQREFRQIQRDLELTVVMVTHDMAEALLLADRIAIMNDGRLIRVATPRDLIASTPATNGDRRNDESDDDAYVRQLMETPRRQAEQLDALAEASDASGGTPA